MTVLRLALLLFVVTSTGCVVPEYGLVRVESTPPGAGFFVPRLGLQGQTPYDIRGLSVDDRIVIGLDGYREWIGRVADLKLIRDGIYRVELEPLR